MKMRRIDVHCMIGSSTNEQLEIRNERELIDQLADYNIDQAIVFHFVARDSNPIAGNEKLLEWTRNEDKLIPCFILSPHYKYDRGWAETERILREENIRFVRICPRMHGFTLHGAHTREIFEMAARLRIHVLIDHSEIIDAFGKDMEIFEHLLKEHHDVNVILTSVSHRNIMVVYGYMENYPNFYVEFSTYANTLAYEEAVSRFGSERLLWGTGMPFRMPGSAITMLSYADISVGDKENIAYKNVVKLMEEGA
jgi:predicted TIM-barrel fold metal-dependent hydrolase